MFDEDDYKRIEAVHGYYLMKHGRGSGPTHTRDAPRHAYRAGVIEGLRRALVVGEDGLPESPPEDLRASCQELSRQHRDAANLTDEWESDDTGRDPAARVNGF